MTDDEAHRQWAQAPAPLRALMEREHALRAARVQGMREAAEIAACAFDDRPRLPDNMHWHDGYERGCRDSAAAILAAIERRERDA